MESIALKHLFISRFIFILNMLEDWAKFRIKKSDDPSYNLKGWPATSADYKLSWK